MKRFAAAALIASTCLAGPAAAQDWELILQKAMQSKYGQTRHDGVKAIDTNTVKGLKALWSILANRDEKVVDWYVREGAYEALVTAEGPEVEAEIRSVLEGKGNEMAKEAIVYSVIWKLRKDFVDREGRNEDEWIEDAKIRLRKARGVEYFKMIKPSIEAVDPDGKLFERFKIAFQDKSTRVRIAALRGFMAYPDEATIPLLLEKMEKLAKKKGKSYREWCVNRMALETLTDEDFRDDVEAWKTWWEETKGFTIDGLVEEKEEEEKAKEEGKMTTVTRGKITVSVPKMKVKGNEEGYPLLVLPWRQYQPDYFRPYFHGIEEECLVYYVELPKIGDFKGLERDAGTNLVVYPQEVLADALVDIMKKAKLEYFSVLGHGPASSALAMILAARHPKAISHMVLINPSSGGEAYGDAIRNVRDHGKKLGNREIEKGAETLLINESNRPTYEPADSAEAGGNARAIRNLRFKDPTDPAVGALDYLYSAADTAKTINNSDWTLHTIFDKGPPQTQVLVFMGTENPWTPVSDMLKVGSFFKGSTTVQMKASEFPFVFETYAFTQHMRKFLKRANKAWKKKLEKDRKKGKKKR